MTISSSPSSSRAVLFLLSRTDGVQTGVASWRGRCGYFISSCSIPFPTWEQDSRPDPPRHACARSWCWYMGFIAKTLKSTRNKLNVPHYCGHSCLIPTHWETRDHFQSVPQQNSTPLTSLHVDASRAPEAFFFGGTCAAWRTQKFTASTWWTTLTFDKIK